MPEELLRWQKKIYTLKLTVMKKTVTNNKHTKYKKIIRQLIDSAMRFKQNIKNFSHQRSYQSELTHTLYNLKDLVQSIISVFKEIKKLFTLITDSEIKLIIIN